MLGGQKAHRLKIGPYAFRLGRHSFQPYSLLALCPSLDIGMNIIVCNALEN
jgi:hypothetical protein